MKDKSPAEKKELIANSFQKHFEHFGFKKTSVDDIAQELQISKKTIYQFFNKKEEIFYFVMQRVAGQYVKSMEKKLDQDNTASGKMEKLVLLIFSETKKWLKKNDSFEFKYKYEIAELAFREAYGKLFKQIVEEGMSSGEFTKTPLDLKVTFIKGLISESMKLLCANPVLEIEAELNKSIIKLLE